MIFSLGLLILTPRSNIRKIKTSRFKSYATHWKQNMNMSKLVAGIWHLKEDGDLNQRFWYFVLYFNDVLKP